MILLAKGGAPLACPLAVRPGRYINRRATGGRTATRDTRDVHARADLRDHCAGPRGAGEQQPAAQPLEPERADMAREAVRRGIVETISSGSIGRFLKEADPKPHRVCGWPTPMSDPEFQTKCADVCSV
jgi:hypothetical protein